VGSKKFGKTGRPTAPARRKAEKEMPEQRGTAGAESNGRQGGPGAVKMHAAWG